MHGKVHVGGQGLDCGSHSVARPDCGSHSVVGLDSVSHSGKSHSMAGSGVPGLMIFLEGLGLV